MHRKNALPLILLAFPIVTLLAFLLGLILPPLLIFPFPFDLPDFLALGILVQMSGNIPLADVHCPVTVLIAILFLHTLDCRLLHFGAQLLPGIVQFHRVELLALGFQLGIFGKSGFQFGGVFLFLLVQFFQVGFHQRNLFSGLGNIRANEGVATIEDESIALDILTGIDSAPYLDLEHDIYGNPDGTGGYDFKDGFEIVIEYKANDELVLHEDEIRCFVFYQDGAYYLIDSYRPNNGRIFRQIDSDLYSLLESLFDE